MIFENDTYFVRVKDDKSGYEVVNKKTDVIESTTEIQPEAIKLAQIFHEALEQMEKPTTNFNLGHIASVDKFN